MIMRVLFGHVVGREGDETFEADEETERMLLESIPQCDRGETIPFEKLLADRQIRQADSWWRDHRPKAPHAIREELARVGARATNVKLGG